MPVFGDCDALFRDLGYTVPVGPFSSRPKCQILIGGFDVPRFFEVAVRVGGNVVADKTSAAARPALAFFSERSGAAVLGSIWTITLLVLGLRHFSGGMLCLFIVVSAVLVATYFATRHFILAAEKPAVLVLIPHHEVVQQVWKMWGTRFRLLIDLSMCELADGRLIAPARPEAYALIDDRGRFLGPLSPWLRFKKPSEGHGRQRFSRVVDLVGAGVPDIANSFPRLVSALDDAAAQKDPDYKVLLSIENEVVTIVAEALAALRLDIADLPDKI